MDSEDEEESFCFCHYLQNCLLPSPSGTCCFSCSPCCTRNSASSEKDQKFPRIHYKPMIDSNILTGNILLQSAQGAFYFPQTSQTLWPEHGAHYRPIKASPVISEQPFGTERVRRSARILAALKGRRRAQTITTTIKPQRFALEPTSPLPSLAQSSIDDPTQPTLTFAAIHDIQSSSLTVFLKFASNLNHLTDNPRKQNSHFFVTVHILPSKDVIFQTSCKYSTEATCNPVFNQDFVFDSVPVGEVAEMTLIFRVFHGRALIGVVKAPLSSIDILGFTMCKLILKITDESDFEVNYHPVNSVYTKISPHEFEVVYSSECPLSEVPLYIWEYIQWNLRTLKRWTTSLQWTHCSHLAIYCPYIYKMLIPNVSVIRRFHCI